MEKILHLFPFNCHTFMDEFSYGIKSQLEISPRERMPALDWRWIREGVVGTASRSPLCEDVENFLFPSTKLADSLPLRSKLVKSRH